MAAERISSVPVTDWHKSTYSGGEGNCVEVAGLAEGGIAVRDSKDPDGSVLVFTPDAWKAFITGIRHEQFTA